LVLQALLLVTALAPAQSRPTTRVDRERMWFAPTAEDWKKPCLVKFQRTYEDALAVSKETGKPILVCINMDGEIASEHYAGVRYRQPEIAKLYEPYVCVIASVYRHTPRDYDEQGKRILCPRFGSVTCGEHIAIEPGLFAQFMDNRRIAPRHIGVELDGKEMYDIFYAWDTDTIFNGLKDGIAKRQPPPPVVKGDRTLVEKVASKDNEDRTEVETAYQAGDAAQRRALMEAAVKIGGEAPVDLLRLGVFGLDQDASTLARKALTEAKSESAVELIGEALRVPMAREEKDALISALGRMGEASPRARTLSVVHQGLAVRSDKVDAEKWAAELGASESSVIRASGKGLSPLAREATEASKKSATDARVANRKKTLESDDPSALLDTAEACLAAAIEAGVESDASKALLGDAREAAAKAEKLGSYGWRTNAAAAVAAYYLGATEEAYARAEAAMRDAPTESDGWNAMVVIALFGEMRQKAIVKAIEDKKDWPKQWLTDVHAAYEVLAKHPQGDHSHVAVHYDFLKWLGASGQAARVLDAGIARFPDSDWLHGRLRQRLINEKGPSGLEGDYERRLAEKDAPRVLEWYAGLASIRAAEYDRRMRHSDDAIARYERGIAHFEKYAAAVPEERMRADHAVAQARAALARLAFERKDWAKAVDELVAAFTRRPEATATPDGFNISAADTARALSSRLKEEKLADLSAKLDAALGRLDPELLRLPAYERESAPDSGPAESRPRRRENR
jgi:hypothetical protein